MGFVVSFCHLLDDVLIHGQVTELKENFVKYVEEVSQGHQQNDHTDSHVIPDNERQRRLEEVEDLLRAQ